MNLIKGESSFWATKNLKWDGKFGWQNEYFAVSVSPTHLDLVNSDYSPRNLVVTKANLKRCMKRTWVH